MIDAFSAADSELSGELAGESMSAGILSPSVAGAIFSGGESVPDRGGVLDDGEDEIGEDSLDDFAVVGETEGEGSSWDDVGDRLELGFGDIFEVIGVGAVSGVLEIGFRCERGLEGTCEGAGVGPAFAGAWAFGVEWEP